MKMNISKIGFLATCFAMCLFVFACNNAETTDTANTETTEHTHDGEGDHDSHADHDHDHEAEVHGEGAEYTSAYVCPMHCEGSGSDTEGKCPKCEMDYVALADHTEDGHEHKEEE